MSRTGSWQGGALSYAELERLWMQAGGPASAASTAAAIALAESGGWPDNLNTHDPLGNGSFQYASGLWQIGNGVMSSPSGWDNPLLNAKLAVSKYRAAGGFTPWGTYDSGAYLSHLQAGITPASNVPYSSGATIPGANSASPGVASAGWWQNLQGGLGGFLNSLGSTVYGSTLGPLTDMARTFGIFAKIGTGILKLFLPSNLMRLGFGLTGAFLIVISLILFGFKVAA